MFKIEEGLTSNFWFIYVEFEIIVTTHFGKCSEVNELHFVHTQRNVLVLQSYYRRSLGS